MESFLALGTEKEQALPARREGTAVPGGGGSGSGKRLEDFLFMVELYCSSLPGYFSPFFFVLREKITPLAE
ncbi:MAG: hypothetical protein D3917_17535 [Candidatus Electrothrix sp. AX5]|nr:hypothetical protein [Candidatus Electrothrix sp. AX5]